MKIIRGIYKNRLIQVPEGIRPLAQRVREACFNIIRNVVPEAKVLDICAGSGSLGLEAISCGAASCTFLDVSRDGLEVIRHNIEALGLAGRTTLVYGDARQKVEDFQRKKQQFDLVFLDPPYYQGLLNELLPRLVGCDIVSPSGFVVGFCYVKDALADDYAGLTKVVDKEYGQTRLIIYEKSALPGDI